MDRAQKRELVAQLNEQWKSSGVLVVADDALCAAASRDGVLVVAHYKGMTVAQMTDFRRRVKEAGGVVKVTKNRLAKLALNGTDVESVADLLQGQTCVAYSSDPISAAKVSVKYAKENDKLVILGGAMGKTRLDGAGVQALADLPSLDELRGRLVGLLQAPASKIARIIKEPGGMLARVLAAKGSSEEAKAA